MCRQEEDIEPKLRDFIQKAVDRAVADFKSMASSQVQHTFQPHCIATVCICDF